jgi:hypothetical protein
MIYVINYKTSVVYAEQLHALWQPVLSSIPDRLPVMDINWTFGHQSGLYAKKEA